MLEMQHPIVKALDESDVAAYNALQHDAVWFESIGHWSSFRGDKAAEALNGLITNDVSLLKVGEGQYAAALSPKGKVLADMLVIRIDENAFQMKLLHAAADSWLTLARKYVNPRLAKIADESDRCVTWMVYGMRAIEALAALGGAKASTEGLGDVMVAMLSEWPVWHHAPWNLGEASVRLIRAPIMCNIPGFILMADIADAEIVREHLRESKLPMANRAVWNVARVESGRPDWGLDMDENTIPQEANLDALDAISFTKGCYTGQETVARLHFRGHVNKQLRGLRAGAPMQYGTPVTDSSGKIVGDVRSSVVSPKLGAIAIAMIRREVALGDTVLIGENDQQISARVVALPFGDE